MYRCREFSLGAALLFLATVARPDRARAESAPDGAIVERRAGGPTFVFAPQRSVPMLSCTVLVPAGSALETSESNGAAHFLEHLLFNGTATRTREQIYAEADLLGAYNNASTQQERTVFQLLLPSENWRKGLELQADMLRNSTLPPDAFEKEKGIILEELAKDRSDRSYEAGSWEQAKLWRGDARSLAVLGTEASISAMQRETVETFYRERYRPAGMTIVVMGDFETSEVRAELTRLYGEGGTAPPPIPPHPEFPAGRRLMSRSLPELGHVRLKLMLPMPRLERADHAGARVLAGWLQSGEKSALHRAVEAADVAPLDVSVSIEGGRPWSLLTAAVTLPVETTEAQTDSVAGAVLAHLAGLDAKGIDGADRASVRRQFLAEELALREKMHYFGLMRADVLASDPDAALHLTDDLEGAEKSAARLLRAAVSDGRVLATAVGGHLPEAERTIARASPERAKWIEKPARAVAALPPTPPRTATTETRRAVLDNGLVVVAHASPDSRTFAAHVLFEHRAQWERALDLPRGAADVLHRMLGNGTAAHDAHELRGLLSNYGASLKVTDADGLPYDDYYFTPEYSYLRLESFDLFGLAALELLAEVVREPRFTPENLEQAVASAATRAAEDGGTPRVVASAQFHEQISPGNSLGGAMYGPPDALRTLDLASLRRLHAGLTAPGNTILTVSSSLPAPVVFEAVRRVFGKERAAAALPALEWRAGAASGRAETKTGRDQSWIVVGGPVEVAREDESAVRLATSILSERLAERLRETEGLAYSIGASVRLAKLGSCVAMEAGTRPANLESMERGMREVAASLTTDPPSAHELEGARNRGEGRDRMRRLSRMGIAYALAIAELRGRDPVALDADLPALRAVTPEDVARVSARYLSFESPIVSIAR